MILPKKDSKFMDIEKMSSHLKIPTTVAPFMVCIKKSRNQVYKTLTFNCMANFCDLSFGFNQFKTEKFKQRA